MELAHTLALQVSAQPDPSGLPGQDKLQGLVNGLYSWSLILVLAALIVAAIAWAWGSHSNHHGAASGGPAGRPVRVRRGPPRGDGAPARQLLLRPRTSVDPYFR